MRLRQVYWTVALAALAACPQKLQGAGNPLLAEAEDFAIVVERLPEVLASSALNVKDLEQATLAFTRQKALPVNAKSRNWLYLRISGTTIRESDDTIGYAYSVRLYFKQRARSMTSEAMTVVSSWSSRGTSGAAQRRALSAEVHAALQDELGEFATAWTTSHSSK